MRVTRAVAPKLSQASSHDSFTLSEHLGLEQNTCRLCNGYLDREGYYSTVEVNDWFGDLVSDGLDIIQFAS